MALESASFISQLNVANPLSTDTVSQADDHLRLIKAVLKNTFPNLSSAVTATASQLNAPVPVGFIGMWSGSTAAIPTGWALCNGSNGTPDLRDRFVVGAGSTYAVGNTGGAATVTLTEAQIPSHTHTISATATSAAAGSHSHTATITDPGHTHAVSGGGTDDSAGTLVDRASGVTGSVVTASATTGISIALGTVAAHTHAISVSAAAATTGGGGSHENRPPYYALAYIMKT
jgi:microcystin-dependent protein